MPALLRHVVKVPAGACSDGAGLNIPSQGKLCYRVDPLGKFCIRSQSNYFKGDERNTNKTRDVVYITVYSNLSRKKFYKKKKGGKNMSNVNLEVRY